MSEKAYRPLPPGRQDWAFSLPDPEGMPSPDGTKRHGAVDWFAPGGALVKAARGGKVVEVTPSRGNSGQVFGGVVKVEESNGRIWVYRHVNPSVGHGAAVKPGQVIARVTDWTDGPDHLHMEVWRSLAGGYNFSNAINPADFQYTTEFAPPRRYFIERIQKGETIMTWDYARKLKRNAYYLLLKAAHPTWALRKYSKEL